MAPIRGYGLVLCSILINFVLCVPNLNRATVFLEGELHDDSNREQLEPPGTVDNNLEQPVGVPQSKSEAPVGPPIVDQPAEGGQEQPSEPQGPPVVGEPPEPPAVGEPQEPPAVGEPQEPPAVEEPQEPPAVGAPQEPPAVGEPQEPPAIGGPQEPPSVGGEPGVDISGVNIPEEPPGGIIDGGQAPPPLLNANGEFNCYPGEENMQEWYEGCEVKEVTPQCYDIKCPDNYKECPTKDGERKKMGERWTETDDSNPDKTLSCECMYVGGIYAYIPAQPIGAPEFPPQKYCDLNGCEYGDEFIKPGAEITKITDRGNVTCRCVEGQDPYLMDASTKYYLNCELPPTEEESEEDTEVMEPDSEPAVESVPFEEVENEAVAPETAVESPAQVENEPDIDESTVVENAAQAAAIE